MRTTLREITIPPLEQGDVITALPVDGEESMLLTIDSELGNGATGIAYLATTSRYPYPLAVKVPRTMSFGSRLFIESRWTPRPSAQHFCYDFLGVRGIMMPKLQPNDIPVPAIITKFYSGGTIKNYLEIAGKCPRPLALRWIVQVATALRAAQVIHRDIKPDNIFLDKDQQAFIADYGLAVPLTAEERTACGISLEQYIVGTPEYMSPESLLSPERIDFRSDLYAIGLVLFEMITGYPARPDRVNDEPGKAPGIETYIGELRKVGFALPLDRVSDSVARNIIIGCTAVMRAKRYRSYDDLIAECIPYAHI